MAAIYKIKVTFETIDYDDWEEFWEEVALLAGSQEEAEELATEEINDSYSEIRDLGFEFLEIIECPPGKFVLNPNRNLVSDCGRFVSDGYILIEKELGFIREPQDRFANPFPEYEAALGEPLGEYAIYDKGQVAVFEAGLFNPDFVQRLNEIGVVVCAVGTREWPAPFALAKDGRYVGVIMPKHFGTNNLLESAESRRKFIEIQRESGSVFSQTQAAQAAEEKTMVKNKHTPGPWKVWASKQSKDIEIQHNGKVPIVKWAGFDESFREHSEHLANAKLMAGSPELLDACKAARAWLGERRSEDWPYDQVVNKLIDQLETAIKKAQ